MSPSRMVNVALVLSLSWAGMGRAQAAPDTAAIRHTVMGFADAWNRHDMVAFGQLFAPDADFVNVTASWWRGRSMIQRQHAFSHGVLSPSDSARVPAPPRLYGMFRHSTMDFTSVTIRVARPDLAIAHVSWRLTGDTRTSAARTGLLTFVLVPTAEHWQIEAAQNTEIQRTVH